jgi:hypothetical protein
VIFCSILRWNGDIRVEKYLVFSIMAGGEIFESGAVISTSFCFTDWFEQLHKTYFFEVAVKVADDVARICKAGTLPKRVFDLNY